MKTNGAKAGVGVVDEELPKISESGDEDISTPADEIESKMIAVRATCVGISPYLMNPATDELLEELRTGVRQQIDRTISAKAQAEKKLCKDDEGRIGIPAINLRSCLVNAGRHVKFEGKSKISTAESTLLDSFFLIRDFFLPFPEKAAKSWTVDKRRGVLDNGTAVCIVRPVFKDWGFTATVEIDEAIAKEKTVRVLFDMAGARIGLGDFRPAKKGPFGRFKVANWERVDPN